MPSSLVSYITGGPAVRELLDHPPVLPDPVLLERVVLPLVARRNVRDVARYLTAAARDVSRSSEDASFLVARLHGMTDSELDRLFTEPEVTDVAERVRRGAADDSDTDLLLAMVGDAPDDHHARRSVLAHHRRLPRHRADESAGGDPARYETGAITVHALPCTWLERRFPEVGWLAAEESVPRSAAQMVSDALDMVDAAWPVAGEETRTLLRWVVPLNLVESFNVPSMRGLIALDLVHPWRIAADLVHETSHNVLSSVLDLRSVSHDPLKPVVSPFVREAGPFTSLIHSCWSFVREVELLHRFIHSGIDVPRYEPIWRKTVKFWELSEPILREHDSYTPFGERLVEDLLDTCADITRRGA